MTVTVRYIGTLNPYFEVAVTGKPTKWTPGRTGDVGDADAALLIATGSFEVYADRPLPFAFNQAGGIAGVRLPSGGIASVGVASTTVAALAAGAVAGTLTPGLSIDENGVAYVVTSATQYWPLATSKHLGTVTLATALAYATPSTGLTADISDIMPSGEPIRIRYNGSAWRAQQQARLRLRGAGSAGTSAQYPTNTRWALPTGAVALFTGLNAKLKFELTASPDTDTVTSWRLKLGTAGTAADTTILAPTGTPLAAGDNQRAYQFEFTLESATSILCDGVSATANPSNATGSGITGIGDTAVTISSTSANALYLGVDYTMGAATNPATLTATYILIP